MNTSLKFLFVLTAVAFTSLFSVQAVPFTMTIDQVGANVVATGSGAINLTGLSFNVNDSGYSALINPHMGALNMTGGGDLYDGLNGPTTFGSGGVTFASSPSSGDF